MDGLCYNSVLLSSASSSLSSSLLSLLLLLSLNKDCYNEVGFLLGQKKQQKIKNDVVLCETLITRGKSLYLSNKIVFSRLNVGCSTEVD